MVRPVVHLQKEQDDNKQNSKTRSCRMLQQKLVAGPGGNAVGRARGASQKEHVQGEEDRPQVEQATKQWQQPCCTQALSCRSTHRPADMVNFSEASTPGSFIWNRPQTTSGVV